LFYKKTYAILV